MEPARGTVVHRFVEAAAPVALFTGDGMTW
jgi:hypothetical protein